LKDETGQELNKHEEKALLLWESYRERLGTSEFNTMYYDLHDLLQPVDQLDHLVEPFSHEEIDNVINELKTDKSSGSDGFNTDFMKNCWNVIKHDFYDLCSSFYNHNLCLQSINGSYITLIPKVDNPSKVSDFRPNFLLNSSIKLITKLLANRLQSVILRAIHQN
jgi:hypothetical protein